MQGQELREPVVLGFLGFAAADPPEVTDGCDTVTVRDVTVSRPPVRASRVCVTSGASGYWRGHNAQRIGRRGSSPGPTAVGALHKSRCEGRGSSASADRRPVIHALTVIFLDSYISGMFEVLVEPHRRRILDLLREGERTVGDLVSELGLSQPGVSKHLRVLRQAGLVEVRADGQRRRYRLRTEPLREIDEWLAPYRAAWNRRLDTLEAHLDDMDE
jgi:DNA-binding transcriptional ArsR family regulator